MNKFRLMTMALWLVLTGATVTTQAQQSKADKALQARISQAVAKSYPASVLMWEIDAETGSRMSAQFSGVVVTKDGSILSAAHVVMPGKTYKVMFADGKECMARGVGRISIPPNFMVPDVATLKIVEKGEWPFAPMGWSSSLKVNEPCISIAYPESVEQRKPNVRFGHISVLKNKYGFVQSTCIMEPGDSGGPLFDLLGRVIGIHSGIEVAEDVNFEIPVDTYRKYWSALNKPKNYPALPADTDVFKSDTLIAAIKALPSINNLSDRLNKDNAKPGKACFKIKSTLDGKEQQISATLFSVEGVQVKRVIAGKNILLSKNSMVGDAPVIMLTNGETVNAKVMARNRVNDLVLLLPDKEIGKGINLNTLQTSGIVFNDLGRLLISPRPDSTGSISVLGSLPINLPKITSYGYMGAVASVKNDTLTFTFIQKNSAAEAGGLLTGDQILTVDGKPVADPLDFLKALQKYRAGDTTVVEVTRTGKKISKAIVLKYPPQKTFDHPAEHFAGGKSQRRDGFDGVFTHDAILKPSECGGPVFDASGVFMGINIARLSRTSTVVLPANIVKQFIDDCLIQK